MNNIGAWIIDYIHMIRGGVTMYLHRKPPKHYLEYVREGKAPVILIPGVFGRWAFLKQLGDKISMLGHQVYIVPKLGSNLNDIPTSASLVREIIDENNIQNAVLIAHSKGGLIGKYLLVHLNKDNKVKGMIAIATPFSGSSITRLLPIKSVRELSDDSKIITDLSSNTGVNSKIVSISPIFDNHIWSKEGSYLTGAKNIKIDEKGHHKIVYSKKLGSLVIKYIEDLSK